MSKNRQQVATGMRALLGGPKLAPTQETDEISEEYDSAATSAAKPRSEGEPREAALALVQPAVVQQAPAATPAPTGAAAEISSAGSGDRRVEPLSEERPASPAVTVPPEVARQPLPAVTREPMMRSDEQRADAAVPRVSVGTIDQPALRLRDQKLTRKFGIVLPVELKDEIDFYCLTTRQRPNVFIERVLTAEMDRLAKERG